LFEALSVVAKFEQKTICLRNKQKHLQSLMWLFRVFNKLKSLSMEWP